MGLLSKVARDESYSPEPPASRGLLKTILGSQKTDSIDLMVDSCVERILRMAKGTNATFTALSILKTLYPYEKAVCIVKDEDQCLVLASIGVNAEDERLREAVRGAFDADIDVGNYLLPNGDAITLFPPTPGTKSILFSMYDNTRIAFVFAESNLPNLASLASILDRIKDTIRREVVAFPRPAPTPQHEQAAPEIAPPPSPAEEANEALSNDVGDLGTQVSAEPMTAASTLPQYRRWIESLFPLRDGESRIQLLVLEGNSSYHDGAFETIRALVSGALGSVFQLSASRIAVAIHAPLDPELFLHRFNKSLSDSSIVSRIVAEHKVEDLEAAQQFIISHY